ncbi:MAG: hypothetical protein IJQ73_07380 [Kiritimatiellae bacterium]|nr:hypothetical protein [Kiritimatiellia bacterium]
MDFRRTLRTSAALALGAFFLALVGSVLWIFDEYLDWDILPDWLESCAMAIVTILLVVSAFAVLTNLVSAVTVVADSLAERCVGPAKPGATRKTAIWTVTAIAVLLAVLSSFQRISEARTRRQEAALRTQYRAEDKDLFERILTSLKASVADSAAKFPADLAAALSAGMSPEQEKSVAEFLNSVKASIPYAPRAKIVLRGSAPYLYQAISPLASWTKDSAGTIRHLGRDNFVALPSAWERDTVAALFDGAELDVPHGRGGALIDTKEPCAWKAIMADGKVVGVLVLRIDDRNRFRKRSYY